jgi:hypothetical protein
MKKLLVLPLLLATVHLNGMFRVAGPVFMQAARRFATTKTPGMMPQVTSLHRPCVSRFSPYLQARHTLVTSYAPVIPARTYRRLGLRSFTSGSKVIGLSLPQTQTATDTSSKDTAKIQQVILQLRLLANLDSTPTSQTCSEIAKSLNTGLEKIQAATPEQQPFLLRKLAQTAQHIATQLLQATDQPADAQ